MVTVTPMSGALPVHSRCFGGHGGLLSMSEGDDCRAVFVKAAMTVANPINGLLAKPCSVCDFLLGHLPSQQEVDSLGRGHDLRLVTHD